MGRVTIDGVGIAVHGHDDDYIELDEQDLGIANLVIQAAGVGSPAANVLSAFKYDGTQGEGGVWHEFVATYRQESGREWPPVYRVRIAVEAEALSDEECAAWWMERRAAEENS
jgi:hypothetical protein